MDKAVIIETLRVLHRDILSEKMALLAVRKRKQLLLGSEKEIGERIKEKTKRFQYNLEKYGHLLNKK